MSTEACRAVELGPELLLLLDLLRNECSHNETDGASDA